MLKDVKIVKRQGLGNKELQFFLFSYCIMLSSNGRSIDVMNYNIDSVDFVCTTKSGDDDVYVLLYKYNISIFIVIIQLQVAVEGN